MESEVKKERTCKAERVALAVLELKGKFPFLDCKETTDFLKLLKKHMEEMKKASNVNETFREMSQDRAAVRYYGVAEKDFKAQIEALIAAEKAKFERASRMSAEAYKRIQAMNESAKATREERKEAEKKRIAALKAKMEEEQALDMDELLKDI